jgi:hypothetical protein
MGSKPGCGRPFQVSASRQAWPSQRSASAAFPACAASWPRKAQAAWCSSGNVAGSRASMLSSSLAAWAVWRRLSASSTSTSSLRRRTASLPGICWCTARACASRGAASAGRFSQIRVWAWSRCQRANTTGGALRGCGASATAQACSAARGRPVAMCRLDMSAWRLRARTVLWSRLRVSICRAASSSCCASSSRPAPSST